jgi:hypothetical protein
MMVVRIPLHTKMSLKRLNDIIGKFQMWFAEFDPKVDIDGRWLVVSFNIKEKR